MKAGFYKNDPLDREEETAQDTGGTLPEKDDEESDA